MPARPVGYCFDERFFWFYTGLESSERWVQPKPSPDAEAVKRRLHNLIVRSGLLELLTPIRPRLAADADILRFHTPEYLARVKAVSAQPGGGVAGHELHAAGGHGYCVFSNVSLAAAYALEVHGLTRVAVVDFDVHHGNGTAAHFARRSDAFVISLHQDGLYPLEAGGVEDVGEGEGRGYNLCVPLPPGSGWGAYDDALRRVVLPALRAYRPQLLLVSAGYDASFLDPLGRMCLTSDHFRDMTAALVAAAEELCGGRLVVAHEGGYSETYVPFCGVAVIEAMRGERSPVTDPFVADVGSAKWQALQPHQAAAVDAAAANLGIALLPPGAGEQ